MESIIATSKKKLTSSIIGMILSGFGITVSAFYDQPIAIVLFSVSLGFLMMFFLILFLRQREEAKYQKEQLEQLRLGARERNRHLKFIFRYNFLFAGISLTMSGGMIVWGIIEAVTISIIVFSIFFGIVLCSSLIIYVQGRETEK